MLIWKPLLLKKKPEETDITPHNTHTHKEIIDIYFREKRKIIFLRAILTINFENKDFVLIRKVCFTSYTHFTFLSFFLLSRWSFEHMVFKKKSKMINVDCSWCIILELTPKMHKKMHWKIIWCAVRHSALSEITISVKISHSNIRHCFFLSTQNRTSAFPKHYPLLMGN